MRRRTAIILPICLTVIALASVFHVYTYTRDTCLECRATREKRWICGIPLHWVEHNSFSRAVLAGESAHRHQWRWFGSYHSYSLIGVTNACGRQHPIWGLPVEMQAQFARLVSPTEFHEALRAIDTRSRKNADERVSRIYERVLDSR